MVGRIYPTPASIEPLCGQDWLDRHRYDYSQADIDSLGIAVSVDGKDLPSVTSSKEDRAKRRRINSVVKSYGKEG